MRVSDIKLPGVHNVENYLAAIAAVDGLVPDEVIRDFAREFGGVEHRIELIRTRKGSSGVGNKRIRGAWQPPPSPHSMRKGAWPSRAVREAGSQWP